jgi:hypothetical protein
VDIEGWLRRIDLEHYAQTFRDNAIDHDVLRDLTYDHLRELGLPLGARLRLLRAVAALGTTEQPSASPEITPSAASSRSCSATWSDRPRFRRDLIPRTCAG